jgi:DNA adenine methylase
VRAFDSADPPLAQGRPLLKWAGGKRQLLRALETYYPASFDRYIEPFVGSGAVFFHLASTGALDGRAVFLSDINVDLIGTYSAVRDRTTEVIAALASLEREHRKRGDQCYYDVRDRRFNPQRARLLADIPAEAMAAGYPAALAAMFIFLNRTGFNGLFRLNRRGEFNVPAGRYTDPTICDAEHVRTVADTLRRTGAVLAYRAFDEAIGQAGAGDFLYCDPPYAPLSRTSNFASYTAGGFTMFDQWRLQKAVVQACQRGAHVVVSNSSAEEIHAAYGNRDARAAQLKIHAVPARRAINSRASSRGAVNELIITNVQPGRRSDAVDTLRRTRPAMIKMASAARVPANRRAKQAGPAA